ncbi:MAG: hypothetical protein HY907_08270 [Deltaproteobacteria bacterium]|nr:hypothetical protein [Deltaproteobacteria bacterium]
MSEHAHRSLALAALFVFASGSICSSDTEAGDPSDTPLAHGNAVVTTGSCPADNKAMQATQLLLSALGGSLDVTPSCGDYKREIATGVTLDQPTGNPATWNKLGGRGERLAEAGLCLLRDLANDPDGRIENFAGTPTPFGDVSIRQRVGYIDFDPVAKRFDGWQDVSICAPVMGCTVAQRQQFSATLRRSSPALPSGLAAGDYPIADAFSLEVDAQESGFELHAELPAITVVTPYGPVSATPELDYGSKLDVIDTPFDGKPEAERLFGSSYWIPLEDTYGRWGTPFHTSITLYPGSGWSSQLGLGARVGTPDGPLWNPDPSDPHLNEFDMSIARSTVERSPTVYFSAGAEITYAPFDILPAALRSFPFSTTFSITVKPSISSYYAAQLLLLAREAQGPPGDVGSSGISQSEFHVATGARAEARLIITVSLKLKITVDLGIYTEDVVDLTPTFDIPVASGSALADPAPHAFAVARLGALDPNIGELHTFSGQGSTNPDGFVQACLTKPSQQGTIPEPVYTPGDPQDLATDEFPCNICIYVPPISALDMGFQVYTLSPYGSPGWRCRQAANGCMDLCSLDPATQQFTGIKKSAPEFVGPRCLYDPPA